MLCRRKPLQAVKGFDERYFLYFEDFDLSLRLGSRGKLAYVPTMKIIHVGGKTGARRAAPCAPLFALGNPLLQSVGMALVVMESSPDTEAIVSGDAPLAVVTGATGLTKQPCARRWLRRLSGSLPLTRPGNPANSSRTRCAAVSASRKSPSRRSWMS